MFTKCPECQKVHPLTVEQLRAGRGMLCCDACSKTFDALAFISETAIDEIAENLSPTDAPWGKERTTGSTYWRVGTAISFLLFVGQIVYFEGYAFSQNPTFRSVQEKICAYLNCRLPAYQNLDEFTVLHGSLSALPDNTQLFRTVISNQSAFTQAYPNINLTLFDYSSKAFTHRVFRPQEYLPKATMTKPAMISDATTEISLNIAAPKNKIGGYTFELTY